MAPHKKRSRTSVTDSMATVQEKIVSAVNRQLMCMADLDHMWRCIPGEKGHQNYIYKIKDRLKADRFQWTTEKGWHKFKRAAPERAIGPSDAELERTATNRNRALELLAVNACGY